jgi:hypothetical protein
MFSHNAVSPLVWTFHEGTCLWGEASAIRPNHWPGAVPVAPSVRNRKPGVTGVTVVTGVTKRPDRRCPTASWAQSVTRTEVERSGTKWNEVEGRSEQMFQRDVPSCPHVPSEIVWEQDAVTYMYTIHTIRTIHTIHTIHTICVIHTIHPIHIYTLYTYTVYIRTHLSTLPTTSHFSSSLFNDLHFCAHLLDSAQLSFHLSLLLSTPLNSCWLTSPQFHLSIFFSVT